MCKEQIIEYCGEKYRVTSEPFDKNRGYYPNVDYSHLVTVSKIPQPKPMPKIEPGDVIIPRHPGMRLIVIGTDYEKVKTYQDNDPYLGVNYWTFEYIVEVRKSSGETWKREEC